MSLWDVFRELPLHVEELVTDVSVYQVSEQFTRKTTVVHLRPEPYFRHIGPEGLGEDVTYDPAEHEPHKWPWVDLLGDWTLESFSAGLDELDLFPTGEPQQKAYRDYRRWAFESAALDLALKQARLSTGEALGREYRDVNFVSSTRATDLNGWLALYPELRFKLDPTPEWTDELIATLAGRGNVDVVDLKGQYKGTVVDNPGDAELYRRVVEAFPNAWIEDPDLTPECDAVLEPHRDRITWDAPIHSWADVEALPFAPKCLNVKPSRFGSLARLFEFYERCEAEGIKLYGGGQFELNVGRGQIQILASLFSADGPNDTAPGGYNASEPVAGLETSPLPPLPERYGFRRGIPG
jgi:hypothetical protein